MKRDYLIAVRHDGYKVVLSEKRVVKYLQDHDIEKLKDICCFNGLKLNELKAILDQGICYYTLRENRIK